MKLYILNTIHFRFLENKFGKILVLHYLIQLMQKFF